MRTREMVQERLWRERVKAGPEEEGYRYSRRAGGLMRDVENTSAGQGAKMWRVRFGDRLWFYNTVRVRWEPAGVASLDRVLGIRRVLTERLGQPIDAVLWQEARRR